MKRKILKSILQFEQRRLQKKKQKLEKELLDTNERLSELNI